MYHLHQEFSPVIEYNFDDFSVQPLLPWRLSRRGPALVAVDINQDGRDELLQGGGRGHRMRLDGVPILDSLSGDATGILAYPSGDGLVRIIVGESNDERFRDSSWVHIYDVNADAEKVRSQKLPFGLAAPSSLSAADIDSDGDLDLFVGAHFIPGDYPVSASSRVYLNQEGKLKISSQFSEPLRDLGLVNGSTFGDLDGDGFNDLVLATEWGSIRIFMGGSDGLTDHTESLELAPFQGWWRGVALGDFDGDGALDIVASNAGWNHRYGRNTQVRLSYGDFNLNGQTDVLESFFDSAAEIHRPSRMLSDLVQVMATQIQTRITSHREFSTIDAHELLPVRDVSELEVSIYASSIFLNRGDHFEHHPLPSEAQYSAAISPVVLDANLDGFEDIILSQNWFAYPMSTPRQDAGRGILLLGQGDGTFLPADRSGFEVYGEGRAVSVGDFTGDKQHEIAFAQHNGPTLVYKKKSSTNKSVYVQFENPVDAIGTTLRVVYSDGTRGPTRIMTMGTGYWSQNAQSTILGLQDKSAISVETTRLNQRSITMSLRGKDGVLIVEE